MRVFFVDWVGVFLFAFLFLVAFLVFQRGHLLTLLLLFEGMALLVVGLLGLIVGGSWVFMVLVVLTFSACEASIGLALVTKMVRFFGSDKVSGLSINKV